MNRKCLFAIVFGAACLVGSLDNLWAEQLDVGSVAPALSIDEWVQGGPVDLSKDASKKVHLVEFWATWCPPCKASVPKLEELQKKYKDQLTIIGVTDPDTRGNTKDAIKKFVKQQGSGMSYAVAIDKTGKTTAAYMEAAGVSGIPHCFLVGKDGKIIWQGSPLEPELESVLEGVMKGTYDVSAAKIEAEVNRRFQALGPAFDMGKWDIVVTGLKDVLKIDPSNDIAIDTLGRVFVEQQKDAKAFRAWASAHIESHKTNGKVLSRFALNLSSRESLMTEAPDLALQAARSGYEAMSPKDLETTAIYARALYQIGALEKAIKIQAEAVTLADGEIKDAAQKVLEYYQRCKELQGSVN